MADSVFKSILDAVKTTITALELEDIADASVKIVDYPPETIESCLITLPGVLIVHYVDLQTDKTKRTCQRDDIGYPGVISLFDCKGEPTSDDYNEEVSGATFDRNAVWQERVRKAFHNVRDWASGIDSVIESYIERGNTRDPNLRKIQNLDAKALYLRVISREARTA